MIELQPKYTRALRAYVANGTEAALMDAYSLGRQSLAEGLTNLVALHGAALKQVVGGASGRAELEWACDRATQFLEEALAPFEMTVRGFQETNARLSEAQAEMQKAAQMKDDFLAHMSHELRTPLNSVLGFSQLLLTDSAGPMSEKQRRYTNHIRTSGEQLVGLINDLLDLSKIRAGLMNMTQEPVDVEPVIDQCLDQVFPLSDAKHLKIEANVAPDTQVTADRLRLGQVLLNLLSNAIKFTPEGGSVAVAAAARAGTVSIAVSDTGVGIPAAEQAHVFDEFVQLEAGQAHGSLGTGLGLTLSRRLVELMGGHLDVGSRRGGGTTFTIALPAARRR